MKVLQEETGFSLATSISLLIFLYQSELLSFFDTGSLTKINTAFSRDQKEKLYVQHRMVQQSKELFAWIENGAHFISADAKIRWQKMLKQH